MSELLLQQEPSPQKDAKIPLKDALTFANADSVADSARDPHEDTIYSYFQISHPRKKNESHEVVSPISKLESQYKLKLSQQQTLVSKKDNEIKRLTAQLKKSGQESNSDSDENVNLMNIINSVKDS